MEYLFGAGAVLGIIAFVGLILHYWNNHEELSELPPLNKEATKRWMKHKKEILEILEGKEEE